MGNSRHVAGFLALSIGVVLSGCTSLPTLNPQQAQVVQQVAADLGAPDLSADVSSPLATDLSPDQNTAMAAMVSDSVTSVQANDELGVSAALADTAGATIQALGLKPATGSTNASASLQASASTSPKPPSLADRQRDRDNELRRKAKEALDKKQKALKSVKKHVTDNADGTKSHKIVLNVDHAKGAQTHTIEKKLRPDGAIAELSAKIERPGKNGQKLLHSLLRKHNDDGSATVTQRCEITRKDGKVKVLVSTRTQAADGSETGTGSITGFDGSTVQTTFKKDATGVVVHTTQDDRRKVLVEITKAEHAKSATVKVTNLKTGKVGNTTIPNCEDMDPSDR